MLKPRVDILLSEYEKLKEYEKENQKLNNVLNELEKWLKETDRTIDFNYVVVRVKDILEKIHELKESDK